MTIKNLVKKIPYSTTLYKKIKKRKNATVWRSLYQDGIADAPTVVTLEITMKCNLRCKMCFQNAARDKKIIELGLNAIKKIIDKLPLSIRNVKITGGEPFIRADIFDILDYLALKGKRFSITTNGTLLNAKSITRLAQYGDTLESLNFSLDGIESTHDRIRGRKGLYRKTTEGMRSASKNGIFLRSNIVIMKDNLLELVPMLDIVKNIGVHILEYSLEMVVIKNDITQSKEILGTDDNIFNLYLSTDGYFPFSSDEFQSQLNHISTRAEQIEQQYCLSPSGFAYDPKSFFDGTILRKKSIACGALMHPRVGSKGNLIFCPFINLSFGNLLEHNFQGLWNSEEITSFRKTLINSGLLPICRRCCKLQVISRD